MEETSIKTETAPESAAAIEVMKTECAAALAAVVQVTRQKSELEKREKELKAQLCDAMEKYGVKKFESESLNLTYVAATTTTKLDGKKLREKYPDIVAEFTSRSNVSAYVKIKVLEAGNSE